MRVPDYPYTIIKFFKCLSEKNPACINHLYFFPELSIHILSLLFILLICKYPLYTWKLSHNKVQTLFQIVDYILQSTSFLLLCQVYKLQISKYINLASLYALLVIEHYREERKMQIFLGKAAKILFNCRSSPSPPQAIFSCATLRKGWRDICQKHANEISSS